MQKGTGRVASPRPCVSAHLCGRSMSCSSLRTSTCSRDDFYLYGASRLIITSIVSSMLPNCFDRCELHDSSSDFSRWCCSCPPRCASTSQTVFDSVTNNKIRQVLPDCTDGSCLPVFDVVCQNESARFSRNTNE